MAVDVLVGAARPRRTDQIEPQVGPPFDVNATTQSPIRWAEQDFKTPGMEIPFWGALSFPCY